MDTQTDETWVTCFWCSRTMPLEEAIEEGWVPDFWDGDVNHSDPVCTSCAASHLQMDSDGELALRPGHPLPEKSK